MRALLLAAGIGKRLRPLTNTTPKCLVEIQGKPLLQMWIDKLLNLKINEIIINTHYLAEKVETFVKKKYKNNNIQLSYEDQLLGTAGTLFHHIDEIYDDDLILIHADNFCLDNLYQFLHNHKYRPDECKMSMLIFRTNKPKESGIVKVDKRMILTEFNEKPYNPKSDLANGAIYCLSKEMLNEIRAFKNDHISDFSTEIIPKYINRILTYKTNEYFIDIGNIESYNSVNNLQF